MKKTINSYFDEIATAKDLMYFDDSRITTMKRLLTKQAVMYIYQLIVKFLLSMNYSYEDIMIICRRHLILFWYIKFSTNKTKERYIRECRKINSIEQILNNKERLITNLLEGSLDCKDSIFLSEFENAYLSTDYKEIDKCINGIKQDYVSANDEEWFDTSRKIMYDYFKYNNSFQDLSYINHFDLMICDFLYNKKLMNFSFELVSSIDIIDHYWISEQKFSTKTNGYDFKVAVLGHIINIIFDNNNLDFQNNKMINMKKDRYYQIMLNDTDKRSLNKNYSFFDTNYSFAEILVMKIDLNFDFKYNEIEYSFTKSGIIKKVL